jgi:hypothetical protein
VARAFEAYSIAPQDFGVIGMTESVLGVYPSSLLPTSAPIVQLYAPTAVDAGNLASVSPADLINFNIVPGPGEGLFLGTETTNTALYSESNQGVTFDTAPVPTNRVGLIAREFFGGADRTQRARVEEGKQYTIRWHVTSTQQSNLNSQIRLRARSAKFMWGMKYEVGGAWATGLLGEVTRNNAIAQQALPGIGTQNPDRYTTDTTGCWYTMVFHSPLDENIRAEYAPGVPLNVRMPALTAQPGPGVDANSRRDLLLGVDVVDTISTGKNFFLEHGNFTIDRIEIREYPVVDPERCPPTEQQQQGAPGVATTGW